MTDWQPISTAPRDGTVVLLARYVRGIMFWMHNDRWHEEADCWADASVDYPPTHWQPLPDPPASTGAR